MSRKKLSIIIVTYNSEKLITNCIDSIFEFNDIGDDLEIIVVDNSSKHQEELFLMLEKKYYGKLTLIKNSKNGGYGQGNNVGIQASTAPYIMIMNPDVTLFMPVFKNQIKTFEEHQKIGIIGLQQYENIDLIKNDSFIVRMPYISNLILLKIYRKLNIFNKNFFCFSGACFFIRKSTFLEAGSFDERIFLYGEETDLQYRVVKNSKANQLIYKKDFGYIHPQHNRDFSSKTYIDGFKSFLILGETQGISKLKMKNDIINYYKRLSFLFSFKNKEASSFYKALIIELEETFKQLKNEKR